MWSYFHPLVQTTACFLLFMVCLAAFSFLVMEWVGDIIGRPFVNAAVCCHVFEKMPRRDELLSADCTNRFLHTTPGVGFFAANI